MTMFLYRLNLLCVGGIPTNLVFLLTSSYALSLPTRVSRWKISLEGYLSTKLRKLRKTKLEKFIALLRDDVYISGYYRGNVCMHLCVRAAVFFAQVTAAFEWQLIKDATSKLAIHRDVFISLIINYESRGLSSRNAFVVW